MMNNEAPDWSLIICSLKRVLVKFKKHDFYNNLNSAINNRSQRMDYECFGGIIYHLFLMIDSKECKKRFRNLYPNRYIQDQSSFIEQTMLFINSKKLIPSKITTTQLRMLGGEPFRRLLGHIIERVLDIEHNQIIGTLKQRRNSNNSTGNDENSSNDLYELSKVTVNLWNINKELEERGVRLEELKKGIKEKKREINEKLPSRAELLDRIKDSTIRCDDFGRKLQLMHNSIDPQHNQSKAAENQHLLRVAQNNKASPRISEIIRDIQGKGPSDRTKLNEKLANDLHEFDRKIDKVIFNWRNQVLKLPEVERNFNLLSLMLPPPQIRPIVWPKFSS